MKMSDAFSTTKKSLHIFGMQRNIISVCFPPSALVTPVGAMYLTQMITEKAFAKAIAVEKAREEKNDESEVEEDD